MQGMRRTRTARQGDGKGNAEDAEEDAVRAYVGQS